MGGSPVAIGPFQGGLNISEDPRLISDNQLAECINFDIGRAGELSTRPGLKLVRGPANPVAGVSDFIRIVGTATLPNGLSRLFVRVYGGFTNTLFYSDSPKPGPWVQVASTAAVQTGVVVTYVDAVNTTVPYAYFVPRGAGAIGLRQNLATNAENTIAGMPRGSGAVQFKGRLFIYGALTENGVGTYRIYYSAAGDFSSWPVNNFFDVGAGDGEPVTSMLVQGDSLIIFKSNSTWVLYFDTDPFKGTLRKANSEVGATSPNSVVSFQNEAYVISRRSIYRLINLLYEDIGEPLNLSTIRTYVDFNLFFDSASVINNKIVCTIATGGGIIPFKYFVYHTDVNSWSEYRFSEYPERFHNFIDTETFEHQYANTKNSPNIYEYKPLDKSTANYGDYPNDQTFFSMATKKYGFSSASLFKRIFWWAIETVGNGRAFDMFLIADDVRTSPVTTRISAVTRNAAKAFVTNRFRVIQFLVRSETPSTRFTIIQMQANLAEKVKVSAGVT